MFEASLLPHMEKADREKAVENYRQVLLPVKVDDDTVKDAWNLLRANKKGV